MRLRTKSGDTALTGDGAVCPLIVVSLLRERGDSRTMYPETEKVIFLPETLVVDTIRPWAASGSTSADFSLLSPQSVPIRQLHLLNSISTHHNDWMRLDFFQAVLALDTLHYLTTSCGDRKTIESFQALVSSAGRNITTMNIEDTSSARRSFLA